MVLEGKALEKKYEEIFPEGKRWVVDLALFNVIFEKLGRNVLDVGCGFGELISALQAFNFECKGMTVTGYEVDVCKQKGLDVIKGDANKKFPYASESFEGIIMLGSIEHFKDYKNALKESNRVLRKSGKIFIETPNRKIFHKTKKCESRDFESVHFKEFSPQELKEELEEAGFKRIEFINKKFYYPRYYFLKPLNAITPKNHLEYICAVAQK